MSTRKTTTKPRERASKKADELAGLARLISAVMRHPRLPSRLYNTMADELCTMEAEIDHDDPDIIERAIEAHERRESRRTGGAR